MQHTFYMSIILSLARIPIISWRKSQQGIYYEVSPFLSNHQDIIFHFSTTPCINNLDNNQCILEFCSTSQTGQILAMHISRWYNLYICFKKSTFNYSILFIPKTLIWLPFLLHIHKNNKKQNKNMKHTWWGKLGTTYTHTSHTPQNIHTRFTHPTTNSSN